jgi:hypothetical protein
MRFYISQDLEYLKAVYFIPGFQYLISFRHGLALNTDKEEDDLATFDDAVCRAAPGITRVC